MDAASVCHWLEQTGVGTNLRESLWLFPAVETVHLLGMALLVGTTTAFDLRLLGWALREYDATEVRRRLLPWAWVGLAVQIATGMMLFASEAVKLYGNLAFRLKMVLLVLAGVNALLFHWTGTGLARSGAGRKVAACVSLLLWLGIVTAGRFIGFV